MKDRFINLYMNFAHEVAKMSRAERLKVGAVVVTPNDTVTYGWNGTPAGWDNTCEDVEYMDSSAVEWLEPNEITHEWPNEDANGRYRLVTKPEVLHAETNCLMKLAKNTVSGAGASLFLTHSPCKDCAKLIYQAGISEVYYRTQYRSTEGIKFLKKCGVKVEQV